MVWTTWTLLGAEMQIGDLADLAHKEQQEESRTPVEEDGAGEDCPFPFPILATPL